MDKDTALRLALEALEVANSLVDSYYLPKEKAWMPEIEEAITAIKAALEAKDKPVAEVKQNQSGQIYIEWRDGELAIANLVGAKLYTTPPQQEAKDKRVQVSPLQFIEMVMEKEDCIGKPIIWAEWPNKEKV